MQRSEQINELTAAMSKVQGAMKHALKDSDNPFFHSKYADFASVIDVAREPLSINGLAVFQSVETDGPDVFITTLLSHSSGQWIESTLRLKPTKNDPQGVASAATYGKRIAFQAMVCIAADADDDGNAASSPEQKQVAKKPLPKPVDQPTVDLAAMVNALADKMRAANDTAAIDACRAEFSKLSAKISADDRAMLVKLAEEAKARVAVI